MLRKLLLVLFGGCEDRASTGTYSPKHVRAHGSYAARLRPSLRLRLREGRACLARPSRGCIRKARGSRLTCTCAQLSRASRAVGPVPLATRALLSFSSTSGTRLSSVSATPAAKHPDLGPSTTTGTSMHPAPAPAAAPATNNSNSHGTAEAASGCIAGAARPHVDSS